MVADLDSYVYLNQIRDHGFSRVGFVAEEGSDILIYMMSGFNS